MLGGAGAIGEHEEVGLTGEFDRGSNEEKGSAAVKLEKLLTKVTRDTLFFGIIGLGYPNSFYKAYVKIGSKWYHFESDYNADEIWPMSWNPVTHQLALLKDGSHPAAVVLGQVRRIVGYRCLERRTHLRELMARIEELNRDVIDD